MIATCRKPDQARELAELQASNPGLDVVKLDCTSEDSIARAAAQVAERHSHLDLLLNVAGILHIPGKMSPGEPSQSFLPTVVHDVNVEHHSMGCNALPAPSVLGQSTINA